MSRRKKKLVFFLQLNLKGFFNFYLITSFLARIIQQLLYYFLPLSILGVKLIQKKLSILIEVKNMKKKERKTLELERILSLYKLEHIWIWLFNFIIFLCGKLRNNKSNFLIVILLEIFARDTLPVQIQLKPCYANFNNCLVKFR